MFLSFIVLLAATCLQNVICITFEVPATQVEEKIASLDYYMLIFCDNPKGHCEAVTAELSHLEYHTKEKFPGIEVATTLDVGAIQKYGISTFPRLMFVRRGEPLFYTVEELDANELREWMDLHREPRTIVLTDDTFEHDTQASTGATTGDWLVMFYAPDCDNMIATWETVASMLHQTKVVARVDTSKNPATKKRFGSPICLHYFLLSQGKFYGYSGAYHDISEIVNFANGGFRQKEGSPVPAEVVVSPFENVQATMQALVKGDSAFVRYMIIGGGVLTVVLIIVIVLIKERKRRAKFD